MQIDGYTVENAIKLERVKDKFPDADDAAILVHYDKLGGLITKGGQKIKTGCFWDAKKKQPYAEPKIIYIYSVGGRIVEVPEGHELPGEVRAAKILEEADAKARKPKARAKKAAEPEEGADEEE